MNSQKEVHEKICSSACCFFSVENVRSLFPSLLEDTGKLLNESVPSSLISFSTSPLLMSGGDGQNSGFGNTAGDLTA